MKKVPESEKLSEYIKEVRSWETHKVQELMKSRTLAWRVAGAAGITALAAVIAVAGLTPLKTIEPYVIRVDNNTGAVDIVNSLDDGKTNYEESINKYFTQWYVRYRESYSTELIEDYYYNVGLMSSTQESQRYFQFINPKNPQSPITVYGPYAKVKVKIKGVSFINENVALVRYTKEIERGADRPQATHWAATVTFKYTKAPMGEKDRGINPLGFQVTDYRNDPDAALDATGNAATVAPAPAPAPAISIAPSVTPSPAPAPVVPALGRYTMKKLIVCAAIAVLPSLALAEIAPPRGTYDARVRQVEYNAENVVKLSTFYGVSTHVQFGKGETIQDVAVGDDQAWQVVARGSHLFFKPKATQADTNVTVITDKRTYQFALVVNPRPARDSKAWADPNLTFSLSFKYPEEEAAAAAAAAKKTALDNRLNDVKNHLTDASKAGQNFDYWVNGAEEVSPTAARDDGRFIYLTFTNNRDMPAVYSVDEKGNEALINTNVIDGNTIVVQRMVKRLMLRKGAYVASVVNKSFDLNGGMDNTSGTVSPHVERVIKGAK